MRTLILTAVLCISLTACADPDTAAVGTDTTAAISGPLQSPEIPDAAQALVGIWESETGTRLQFRIDGTVSITGRDSGDMAFRVMGDSLLVTDSGALSTETIPPSNRYAISTLTPTSLTLMPLSGRIGGVYTREGGPTPELVQ